MENDNHRRGLIEPIDFGRLAHRMRPADFIPIYGLFKHDERFVEEQPITDYIDDGIFLGLYNSVFVVGGLYVIGRIM
ncbi:MAG TPA: hypothetical protein VJA47_06015 [archaeon]|nr:hypothetical protein [archaeon]